MSRALPTVLIAQFTIPLSIAGTAVALPSIATEFGGNPTLLQWSVNAFNVTFAISTVLWGVLADRIGHRTTFIAGVWIAALGSAASAAAPGLIALDLARAVTGAGAGAVLTGAATLLSALFDGAARKTAFTWFGIVNGLGLAAGPALSGAVVSLAGWRSPYVVQTLVLVFAGGVALTLPHPRVPARTGRLLDFAALRNPQFAAMAVIPVAGAIGFVTLLTYGPTALEAIHGWSPAAAGAAILAMTAPVVVAPPLVHRFADTRQLGAIALGCLTVGLVGMLLLRPGTPAMAIVVPMLLLGSGFGIPLGFVDREALTSVPADRAGAAAGVFNLLRIGSEAVFVIAFAGLLFALVSRNASPQDAGQIAAGGAGHASTYYSAFAPTVAACALLCGICWAAFTILTRRKSPTPQQIQNLAGSR